MTKVVTTPIKKIVNLLLVLISCYALRSPKLLPRLHTKLSSTTQKTQNDVIEELIRADDLPNVFTLLLRNPTIYPSPKQSTLLLNNLNILAKMSSGNDISKFYTRLLKGGKAIPSFGVMAVDGPLSEVSLPKFEALMTVDPNFLQKVSEIDQATYDSLRIPNELGVMSSASRSGLETRVKLQMALLFAFLDFGCQLVVTADTHTSLVNVAATFAIAAGLAVLESPPFLNGEIGRRIGWFKSTVTQVLSAEEKNKEYRYNAATFLVSYLLGSPIQEFDLEPNSPTAPKKFRYPDAPRVEMRDPALSVLEQTGQIDLAGLKRLATVHMTASAMKAIDGSSTPKIADYSKILLAALAQRSANPQYSTIPSEEFPNRLLPTLARWGFVEAAMIIREHASAIDGLVEVFETGGGVGDAIAVIERNVAAAAPNSALMMRRNRRIKLESEVKQRDFSTYNAIEAIGNAKLLATPAPDPEDLEPIELIKGTSRTYTRAELVLPPNPSPAQVKTLAREIMMNRLQADEVQHGKASERTKKEITTLYEQVSAALQVYENTEEAKIGVDKDFDSPPLAKGEEKYPETLRDSRAYMRTMMVAEETENLLSQVGLSQQKLAPLQFLPSAMRNLDFIGETVVQLNTLKDSYWSNYYNIEALWVFRGSVYFERFTGLAAISAVDSVWDATGLSTRVPKSAMKDGQNKANSQGSGKVNKDTVKELNELVSRIRSVPPTGADTRRDRGANGQAAGDLLKSIKMIPVTSDSMNLIPREEVNRSHEQRKNALMAARTMPSLIELMPPLESTESTEAAQASTITVDPFQEEELEPEEESEYPPVSPVNMMILGNIGASYRTLDSSIEKINALDAFKSARLRELEEKLVA